MRDFVPVRKLFWAEADSFCLSFFSAFRLCVILERSEESRIRKPHARNVEQHEQARENGEQAVAVLNQKKIGILRFALE
jgi:hypothetical protein